MKRRWLITILALVLCGISLAIFWDRWFFFPSRSIRIGINAYSGYEYFVLAKKQNFFAKAGLKVELIEFGSLGDVQQAFEWKQIDAMVCNLIDVIVTQHKTTDLDPKIVLIPSYPIASGASVVLGSKPLHALKDLKGKKIGVEVHSWGCFFLMKALKTAALTLDDVTLIPADPTALHSLLRKGHIEAAVSYPPYSQSLLGSDLPLNLLYSSHGLPKEMILNVLAIEKNFLTRHFHELLDFVALWDELLDFKEKNPQAADKSLARYSLVNLQEAHTLFESSKALKLEEQMCLFRSNKYLSLVIEEINDLLKKAGIFKGSIGFESIFDRQLIQSVIDKKTAR